IPVELRRTGARSVVYGGSLPGTLELRYLRTNADVRAGDVLVTSGLDGVFAAGLPVGAVRSVEIGSAAFVHVLVDPAAQVEGTRLLLVLLADPPQIPKALPPEDGGPRGQARGE